MPSDHDIERIIRELNEKRDRALIRGDEITDERRALAFAAHAENDSAARKRLSTLNLESVTIAAEIETIDAALAEANSRLDACRRAAEIEADQAAARELREVLGEFRKCGRQMEDALAAFVGAAVAFREHLTKIHNLGCDFPSHGLADVNARLAIGTALMQTPWRREFEHLAPGERRTFTQLVDGWAARIEPGVRRRLGEAEDKAI
jgi:hypothetical protein